MASILVCSVPFTIISGIPTCVGPGILSTVDLSLFVGTYSATPDPVICLQAFASGFIIATPLMIVSFVGRIFLAPLFYRYIKR